MSKFREWWIMLSKVPQRTKENIAKLAWNNAIEEAALLVEENYDECEPWITPEEIRKLAN